MLIHEGVLLWHVLLPGNWVPGAGVTDGVRVAGKRRGATGAVPPQCFGHHQGIDRTYFQSDCLKVSSFIFKRDTKSSEPQCSCSRAFSVRYHLPALRSQ
jgi:hypothetical protein